MGGSWIHWLPCLAGLIIPVVPKLWHMQKKVIPTQAGGTASHYPWRMNLVIFFNQFLETLDILIRTFSFTVLHFIAFCENNRHWYLKFMAKIERKKEELIQWQYDKECESLEHVVCTRNRTLFRPSQLAQSRSIFWGGTLASTRSRTLTKVSLFRK